MPSGLGASEVFTRHAIVEKANLFDNNHSHCRSVRDRLLYAATDHQASNPRAGRKR